MAWYDIETGTARRWPARLEGDTLVIDLNEQGLEVTGNRTKDRSPDG